MPPTQRPPFDRSDVAVIKFGLSALHRAAILLDELDTLRAKLLRAEGAAEEAAHLLTDICSNVGMASVCLFDTGPQRSSREKPRMVARRQLRSKSLIEICQGIDIDTLTNRDVRNRLIHADEYLARMVGTRSLISACTIEYLELVRTPEGSKPILYDRVFLMQENRMLHLDKSIDLTNLRESCRAAYGAIVKAAMT